MSTTDNRIARYTLWLTILTGVLAVATIALFVVTWSIAESTRQTSDDTRRAIEASNRQAAAAEHANETAKRAVDITQDTAKRQLRAYIAFSDEKKRGLDRKLEPLAEDEFAILAYKNTGTTPAYRLQRFRAIKLVPYPFANNQDPDILGLNNEVLLAKLDEKQSGFTVGPGAEQSFPADFDRKLTRAEIGAFDRGDLVLYVMGAVVYQDVFGDPHFDRLCYFHRRGFGRFYPCLNDGESR